MRFVSRSVVTGFVNALAILIFMAQMPELLGKGMTVYLMTAIGLAIIYGLPYLTKAVPSPLVTIVLMTAASMYFGFGIRTVGDMGALPSELPFFALPQVPLTLETLKIILPYALTLAMVGLLESLMTAAIIDEMTDTGSDKNRECAGQGLGNITAGLFGGMAGSPSPQFIDRLERELAGSIGAASGSGPTSLGSPAPCDLPKVCPPATSATVSSSSMAMRAKVSRTSRPEATGSGLPSGPSGLT